MKMGAEKVNCFLVIFIIVFVLPASFHGQGIENSASNSIIFEPAPIGGLKAIQDRVIYPASAKKYWIEGDVFLEACVDTDGTVIYVKVVQSDDQQLNDAAVDALRRTKFNPAFVDDNPIKSRIVLRVTFKMEN